MIVGLVEAHELFNGLNLVSLPATEPVQYLPS